MEMEQMLLECCKINIKLLDTLFAQSKISREEYEKEVKLKWEFIEKYAKAKECSIVRILFIKYTNSLQTIFNKNIKIILHNLNVRITL